MRYLFIFVTIILQLFCDARRLGQIKKWLPDLEWTTSKNWMDNSVPESGSRISFPLEMFHSVGFPSHNLIISGFELPRDGALLLSQNGNLKITDKQKNTKLKIWKQQGAFYWADTSNWNSSSATPHLERIPCSMDTVIFPEKNRSLSLRLPNTGVTVMEIRMGEKERIDEWHWKTFVHGREFKHSPTSVSLSGLQYCGADCLCKSYDSDELLAEICQFQRPKCGRLECEYPLQVEGHCCQYCGARITIENKWISIIDLDRVAMETLKNFDGSISWHTRASRQGTNNEVLITENGIYSGIKSQEAIDKLSQVLIAKNIPVIEALTTGAPLTGSTLANTLGPFFGAPFIIFLLILVALPYFGYSYTYVLSIVREAFTSIRDGERPDATTNTSSFSFARFENVAEGDVQIARAINAENEMLEIDNEDNENVGRGKRFENPLYRSRRKSLITNVQDDSGNIVNIDTTTVSLTELQKKVYPSDEVNGDSD